MEAESSSKTSLGQQALEAELEQRSTLLMAAAQKDVEQQALEVDLEHQSTLLMATVQKDVEQQVLEVDLEHQSTLLMAAAQKDVEQQLTQPMAVEQHPADQQATLPMAFKPGRRFSRVPHMLLPLWLGTILIAGLLLGEVLTGHTAVGGWLAHVFTHNAAPTVVPVQQVPIAPTPAQSSSIDSVTVGFMDAMMHKDWGQMWLMLAPAAQQLWQGENDFIHFEQAKFGSLTLVSFKEAAAQIQLSWLDPETTQVYPDVATQRVSLAATAPRGLLTGPSNAALDSSGLFNNTLFALLPDHGSWLVLVAGPADQDAPVLVPASSPATRLLVPIFMYHHVSNQPTTNALDYNLTVTTTDFNAQLTWLQQQGYQTITLTELFDALYYGKALPAHPMILTFDDGYEDMYTDALPTLLAHHYRGVFFIITGMIGGRYLTWNQIRVLESYGMQIGSHTIHHINVGQPPAWTTTQKELVVSQATLQFQLGQPIQFFCYPTGEPFHHDSVYEQQIVLADLLADGYIGALLDPFTSDSAIQDAQTPYQLPRIRVSGGESLQAYMGILNVTLQYGARTLAYN